MEQALQEFLQGVQQIGLELSEQQLTQLLRYRDELLDWNTRMNLTAIKDPVEVLSKHFLDSLSLLQIYNRPQTRLLDIGTGAGFPGLPLKIACPDWQVVLMDATGKRIQFLKHVIGVLGLQGVEAVQGRAEELGRQKQYRGMFDLVTARAVSSIANLLENASPFCRVCGKIIFPKKGLLEGELEQGKRAAALVGVRLEQDYTMQLPGLEDGRRLFILKQEKVCPEQYPRSGAAIAKKPLGR